MGKGNKQTYMVEIIMDRHRGKYGVVNINIPKDIKDQAKDFCKVHGLVFTKFVEHALKDRMKKVKRFYEEMDN